MDQDPQAADPAPRSTSLRPIALAFLVLLGIAGVVCAWVAFVVPSDEIFFSSSSPREGRNLKVTYDPQPATSPQESKEKSAADGERARGAALRRPAAPPAGRVAQQQPADRANRNAWYGSRHVGGTGHLAHTRKLIDSGVKLGSRTVKLESFVQSYRQDLPLPADGSVGLSVATDHALQPAGGGTAYLQIALKGTPRTPEKRLPLNVHLVLDRSGSMRSGGKMEQALLAAKEVVRQLVPHDVFSLVIYDNEIDVLVPAGTVKDKQQVYRLIDGVTPRGATNIYGALEQAYAQERKFHSDEFLNLVLLVSDGKATAGPRSPSAIGGLAGKAFERGVQSTSVGLGLDYNEQTMIEVARRGRGSYHFIEESESVALLFRKEFEELGRTVAMALKTRIVLDRGVELRRVLGFEQLGTRDVARIKGEERRIDSKLASKYGLAKDRTDAELPGIKFYRTTLHKGQAQIYLLEIGLPPGKAPRQIATIHFQYKDMLRLKSRGLERAVSIRYGSEQEVAASLDRKVMKNQLGFETGYALRKAAFSIGRGETGAACDQLAAHQRLVESVARERNDADLLRDAELLARYTGVMEPYRNQDLRRTQIGQYLMKTFSYEGFRLSQ